MTAGIALGFYGRIVGPRIYANAIEQQSARLREQIDSRLGDKSGSASDVRNLVKEATIDMAKGQNAFQLEGLGKWWFFTGLAIFLVSQRHRRNIDICHNQSKEYDSEQAGPGYPPQGVGSPDP